MKKILLIILTFCLSAHLIYAQAITITNANNSLLPGTSGNLNYAYIHASSTQSVYFTITITGTPFIQNLGYAVDFINWNASSIFTLPSGTSNWNTSGYVPAGTACGLSETITHKFYNTLGQLVAQCSYTFTTPATPTLTISSPAALCSTTAGTFTVNGNQTGTGTYTWTSTNSNFKINGLNFPQTTTSNSVQINSTVVGASSTIGVTVNGATGICGQFNSPSKFISSVSTSLTAGGPDCIAPKSFGTFSAQPSGSSGYVWQISPDQVNWTNMSYTTSSFSYSFQNVGTYHFRVRRTVSGCTSNWAYFTSHCTTSGYGCRTAQAEITAGENLAGTTIFPNPSIGDFYLSTTDFNDPVNIIVYDVFGKKVDEKWNVPTNQNGDAISFGGSLSKGIYTVEIYDGNKRIVKRIVKAE